MGVRVPAVRKLARRLARSDLRDAFLAELPHPWFEEDELHAFVLCLERDYAQAVRLVDEFLPYVDNWAVCDALNPMAFKSAGANVLHADARRWMASDHTYTRRFGIGVLMRHLLEDGFQPTMLAEAAAADNGDYYVRMGIAWYFATALDKRWDEAIPWIEQRRMEPWVHNKSIQKAVESRVIPAERKDYLRTLRVHRR